MGVPCKVFTWEYCNKSKVFYKIGPITPLQFYREHVQQHFDVQSKVILFSLFSTRVNLAHIKLMQYYRPLAKYSLKSDSNRSKLIHRTYSSQQYDTNSDNKFDSEFKFNQKNNEFGRKFSNSIQNVKINQNPVIFNHFRSN